jgi:hypothetical protein
MRAADNKTPVGLMRNFVRNPPYSGENRVDDVFLDLSAQGLGRDAVIVLRGDDHRIQPGRFAVDVLDADLALAVGAKKTEPARAAHLAQLANQLVGQHDGQRHQLRGFIARVAEHHALIACSTGIHTHGYVGIDFGWCSARRRSWRQPMSASV